MERVLQHTTPLPSFEQNSSKCCYTITDGFGGALACMSIATMVVETSIYDEFTKVTRETWFDRSCDKHSKAVAGWRRLGCQADIKGDF